MRRRLSIALILVLVIVAGFGTAIFLKTAYVVPVLMYHSVDYDYKATKLSVSPESFEREMEFLHKNHYNVVSLEKAVSYIERRGKIPPKTLAITFDDGYYNNYKYAYPVLKRYDIPATIFVIIDYIGKPGYLGWDELKEMADSGIIDIGSHSMSHAWLPSLDQKQLAREVSDSKRILEERLGRSADLFCYPSGAFDDRVKKAVKDAGYRSAVATNPGRFKPIDDLYAIKRIRISRTSDNLFVFWIETSGYYTWIKEHRDE